MVKTLKKKVRGKRISSHTKGERPVFMGTGAVVGDVLLCVTLRGANFPKPLCKLPLNLNLTEIWFAIK